MPQQKPKSQTQGELKLSEGKNKPAKIKYTPTPDLFTKAKGKKEDWRPKGATQESFSLDYPGRAEREAARAAERAKLAEQQRIDSMQKKFSFMGEKPSTDTRGAKFRETFKPTYEKVKSISAANPGNKGLQDLQSTWDSFMDKKMAGEKNTPTTRAMAGMLRQARARGKGALGTALAAMGGAGMADEGWAAGMASGGGKGGYQPTVRKRTAYPVREQ